MTAWDQYSKDVNAREIARTWREAGLDPQNAASGLDDESDTHAGGLATRWTPIDLGTLPRREWVIRDIAVKRNVSVLAGPPGTSKSTLTILMALAAVTGRPDIYGMPVVQRTRVWLWNQEDDIDELHRRLAAQMQAYGVSDADLCDERGECMLFLDSGVDRPLLLAARGEGGGVAATSHVSRIVADVQHHKIGLVILDPLVELHQANENDNAEMREVLGIARSVAVKGNCAVYVSGHTRKPDKASSKSYAGDMDSLRGGSSQPGVARIMFTLYSASEADAKQWQMPGSYLDYVRLDHAKNNLGPRWKEPRWFKKESVAVGGLDGEQVGILRPVSLQPVARISSHVDILEVLAAGLARLDTPEQPHDLDDIMGRLSPDEQSVFPETKNRARTIRAAFDGASEYMTEHGVMHIVNRRGRGGLGFKLIPQTPQTSAEELLSR